MQTLFAVLALSTLSLLAFGLAAGALTGLRGTCSRACDREGRPICDHCPRRDETGSMAAKPRGAVQHGTPPGDPTGGPR